VRQQLSFSALCICFAIACSATNNGSSSSGNGGDGNSGNTSSQGGTGGGISIGVGGGIGGNCSGGCSTDGHQVLDCGGNVIQTCSGTEGCDPSTLTCKNACQAAVDSKLAVGCDYYATMMDQIFLDVCFAAFVANTWDTPAHIAVSYQDTMLPVATFTRIPQGSGATIQYLPYDDAQGLQPGQVAIVFLSGGQGFVTCPAPSAIPSGVHFQTTGYGNAFHITTDVPVVAYQINPYGGGSAATTAASLLLSTSVWDTNYVAVTVSPYDIANPSLNIVGKEDGTTIQMVPTVPVVGGGGVPAGAANQVMTMQLNHGQHIQISQQQDLTGSIISADKPIGFMAGQNCMRAPIGYTYCDHGEQMIPPVKALGSEYVGVMYRPRVANETQTIWKMIGAVDGTQLTWTPNVGGPATLNAGQLVEFNTGTPFVVKSQDADHPFILMTYMSSNGWVSDGYGDPDLVVSVPPQQYLARYVFFADPTYPETSLVIVRSKHPDGTFKDVTLDCGGVIPANSWTPVGDYEWARIDLMKGDFVPQGNCSTGAHEMHSDSKFGLWVWGWGTPETFSISTRDVSYGYPGGMNVQQINDVVIPPTPR
jgi:IgGFc binding protein